jgi:hypothetical protein
MYKALGALLKQPYWVITLVAGVALVLAPSISIGKYYSWNSNASSYLPIGIGIALIVLSALTFSYSLFSRSDIGAGVDLARVKEGDGALWTTVGACEIRVGIGRIERHEGDPGFAIVLPCNEYFDDRCVDDTRSALGAYANRAFEGQVDSFVSLMKDECGRKLGVGVEQQKTDNERA